MLRTSAPRTRPPVRAPYDTLSPPRPLYDPYSTLVIAATLHLPGLALTPHTVPSPSRHTTFSSFHISEELLHNIGGGKITG